MRNRRTSCQAAEQLEQRILPTVSIGFNTKSGLLKLTGDGTTDRVGIDNNGGSGGVNVSVNHVIVGTYAGVKSIKADFGGGDDYLRLGSIQIPGNVTVSMGEGTDEINVFDFVEYGDGPSGRVQIGGFFKADLGGDEIDFVKWVGAIQVGGNVSFKGIALVYLTGGGTDLSVESGDISLGGNLSIQISGHATAANGYGLNFRFDNLNVQGRTTLAGSSSNDVARITNSYFRGKFSADLGDGSDEIDVRFNEATQMSRFDGAVLFSGGIDDDTLKMGTHNIFAQQPSVSGFETIV